MKKKKRNKITTFDVINAILLCLAAFTTIYPFLYILATSFSSSRAILSQEVIMWPIEFNTNAYHNMIEGGTLLPALKNTVILAVGGTILNMIFTIMVAYPISKANLRGRNIFISFIVFTMMFNGGMIPTFLLVHKLNLLNNFLGIWLVTLVSTYNLFIMKNYFEGLPKSLEESAFIDGANHFQILFKIVIPLSKPVLATLVLFYAVGHWNSYFNEMIYLPDSKLQPIMVKLMQMIKNAAASVEMTTGEGVTGQDMITPEGVRAAAVVVATLPIMCFYPFIQKYFVKGVMLGAVKG